eukprot:CAMPEP_0114249738 /NCGR_PEP_ID=MMETSP0058-20121206/14313_1 /TAXON_ID=36894 /ORGANISM="Pyramimonas parkeae, CCMP726" /LENGTH=222 /DNA_ID=CAMNT_0001363325 /DNA_START=46 /DNA_END=714 /DNA_ORIENTATION=-
MRTQCVAAAVLLILCFNHVTARRVDQHPTYQSCLASPSTCTRCDIPNSGLSGTIPTEIGTLTRITHLGLGTNRRITGTLPTELGMLTSLTNLFFDYNQLTGSIPNELSALTRAKFLVCYNAALCGDVPAGVTLGSDNGFCFPTYAAGTQLGSACPTTDSPSSSATQFPTVSPTSSPTSSPTDSVEQPLKDNWFRKRDVARKKAFPQKTAWFRKHDHKKAKHQ